MDIITNYLLPNVIAMKLPNQKYNCMNMYITDILIFELLCNYITKIDLKS